MQTLLCVAPWTDSVGIDAKMPFDLLGVVVGIEPLNVTPVVEVIGVGLALVSKFSNGWGAFLS